MAYDMQKDAAGMCSILVVDDEPEIGEVIKLTLRSEGHAIDVVTSSEDALKKFNAGQRYDVVLTDHRMAGMSGAELAQEIRSRSLAKAVVLYSGTPPTSGTLAVDLVLSKPFSSSALRKAVAEMAKASAAIIA